MIKKLYININEEIKYKFYEFEFLCIFSKLEIFKGKKHNLFLIQL